MFGGLRFLFKLSFLIYVHGPFAFAFAVGGGPCLLSLLVLVAICFSFYIWCLFRLAVVFLLVYYGVALAWVFAFGPCGGKF